MLFTSFFIFRKNMHLFFQYLSKPNYLLVHLLCVNKIERRNYIIDFENTYHKLKEMHKCTNLIHTIGMVD